MRTPGFFSPNVSVKMVFFCSDLFEGVNHGRPCGGRPTGVRPKRAKEVSRTGSSDPVGKQCSSVLVWPFF